MERCLVHPKIARKSSCRGGNCIPKDLVEEGELRDFRDLHRMWGTKRIIDILEQQPFEKRKETYKLLVRQTNELDEGKRQLSSALTPFKDYSQNLSVPLINDTHSQDNHNELQGFLGHQNFEGIQSDAFLEFKDSSQNLSVPLINDTHEQDNHNELQGFLGHQNLEGIQSDAFLEDASPTENSGSVLRRPPNQGDESSADLSLGRSILRNWLTRCPNFKLSDHPDVCYPSLKLGHRVSQFLKIIRSREISTRLIPLIRRTPKDRTAVFSW
ncbi:hypothetical protein SLE2022_312410 [Rubroshorea leprosula]